MLAADKLQLQSALKQQATALKEKEFNLHHSNLMTVGTQAAVLAGLDVTMFIEFNPAHNSVWGDEFTFFPRALKFMYYIMIISAFCSNMIVVSHTTTLSVLGAGLALRGPDGSMVTATDGLYEERKAVFYSFGWGLACTISSVVIAVWLILHWEAALICMTITIMTCIKMYKSYRRIVHRYNYDESETVNFDDIFHGPAAIQVVKHGIRSITNTLTMSPRSSRRNQDDQQTYVQENRDREALMVPDMNGEGKALQRRGRGENNV